MLNDFLTVKRASGFQKFDDVFVRVFDILAGKFGHLVSKLSGKIDRTRKRFDTVSAQDSMVVFAEGGRLMDQPGTTFSRDVVVADHHECASFDLIGEIWKQRWYDLPTRSLPVTRAFTSNSP